MTLPLLLLLACSGSDDPVPTDTSAVDSGSITPILVVTYNTGTTEGLAHDAEPDDGYSSDDAILSDTWYGDGLAWNPAVEAATTFFTRVRPDVVGFQEIFFSDDCATIPVEAHADFVCTTWMPGDPTVAQVILGPDYQVACHPGKSDKCLAVRKDFGTFTTCDADFCLDGLDGGTVEGCGSGARVARGTIERSDGSLLTIAHVHGSSGIDDSDKACRVQQIDQVFVDLDGEPAANGSANIILGDFNTDPGRWTGIDASAAAWATYVDGDAFHWVTEAGPDAPLTYQGVATIDHVVSDVFQGDCWHAGVTDGEPAVLDAVYFDHSPAVCSLIPRE